MKKILLQITLITILLCFSYFNPSKEEFIVFYTNYFEKETKNIVKNQAIDRMGLNKNSAEKIGNLLSSFSGSIASHISDSFDRKNYIFISIYESPGTKENNEKFIGILTMFFKV